MIFLHLLSNLPSKQERPVPYAMREVQLSWLEIWKVYTMNELHEPWGMKRQSPLFIITLEYFTSEIIGNSSKFTWSTSISEKPPYSNRDSSDWYIRCVCDGCMVNHCFVPLKTQWIELYGSLWSIVFPPPADRNKCVSWMFWRNEPHL